MRQKEEGKFSKRYNPTALYNRTLLSLFIFCLTFFSFPLNLSAASAGYITFEGRGYGHGVGMSMTGVYYLSGTAGWSYSRILQHYYTGIKWGKINDNTVIKAEGRDGVIRDIKMKDYLYRLAEEPNTWPREGLRSTIVAARTYAWEKMQSKGYVPKWGQLFIETIDPADRPRIVAAVNDTAGVIMTYGGKPIVAAYSSSAGGYTASMQDVWGGTGKPYLAARPSSWDKYGKNYYWKSMVDSSVIESLYPGIGTLRAIKAVKRSGFGDWGGRAVTIRLTGSKQVLDVNGYTLAQKLGLKSNYINFAFYYDLVKARTFRAGTTSFSQSGAWESAVNDWKWHLMKQTGGDYSGDGAGDAAVLNNYGTRSKLWVFKPQGTQLLPGVWWDSATSYWDASMSSVTTGDFDGDSKADVAILYNYGTRSKLWVFKSLGNKFAAPQVWWDSGASTWYASKSKMVAGDFNADGKSDIAILYDYGRRSKLRVFKSLGNKFSLPGVWWDSGLATWYASKSKVVAGDFNADGKSDIGILYDNGLRSKLWVFNSYGNKFGRKLWWDSAMSEWQASRSKIVAGDFSGDGKDDFGVLYNYYNVRSKFWVFKSTGSAATPKIWWDSALQKWNASKSKIVVSDHNADGKDDFTVFQNYGNLR